MKAGNGYQATPRNVPGGSRGYVPPSREQKLEKKVAAAERKSLSFPSTHVNDMAVVVTDKIIGDDALILRLGQESGYLAQIAIHRPIGFDMQLDSDDWVMSSLSNIPQYKANASNPFEAKTRERVSKLKEDAAIRLGVLKYGQDGSTLLYPNGKERAKMLDSARVFASAHNKVQGSKAMSPAFSYMDLDDVKAEIRYLNALAGDKALKAEVQVVIADYLSYQTMVSSTGQTQTAVPYLKGIPSENVQSAVLEVVRTGSLPESYKSLIKPVLRKEHQFEMWAYTDDVSINPQKLHELKDKLTEFMDANKAYNSSRPQGREAESKESNEDKSKRKALLAALNTKVKEVNEIENFKKVLPKVLKTPATGPSAGAGKAPKL